MPRHRRGMPRHRRGFFMFKIARITGCVPEGNYAGRIRICAFLSIRPIVQVYMFPMRLDPFIKANNPVISGFTKSNTPWALIINVMKEDHSSRQSDWGLRLYHWVQQTHQHQGKDPAIQR